MLPSYSQYGLSSPPFGGAVGGLLIPLKIPSQPYKSLALLSQGRH